MYRFTAQRASGATGPPLLLLLLLMMMMAVHRGNKARRRLRQHWNSRRRRTGWSGADVPPTRNKRKKHFLHQIRGGRIRPQEAHSRRDL